MSSRPSLFIVPPDNKNIEQFKPVLSNLMKTIDVLQGNAATYIEQSDIKDVVLDSNIDSVIGQIDELTHKISDSVTLHQDTLDSITDSAASNAKVNKRVVSYYSYYIGNLASKINAANYEASRKFTIVDKYAIKGMQDIKALLLQVRDN